jgi:transposase, IS6 family
MAASHPSAGRSGWPCLRVGGRWRCLWRAVDQVGQPNDFRLSARRDARAARAFLRQARDTARRYRPLAIVTDKAHSHAKVSGEIALATKLSQKAG